MKNSKRSKTSSPTSFRPEGLVEIATGSQSHPLFYLTPAYPYWRSPAPKHKLSQVIHTYSYLFIMIDLKRSKTCLSTMRCLIRWRWCWWSHMSVIISCLRAIPVEKMDEGLPPTGVPGSHPNIVLGMLGRMELRTPSIPKSHPKSFGQCKRNRNVDRMNS